MSLSVVIPAFNEANPLAKTVVALSALFAATPDFEIIVVNDGSSDTTLQEAQALTAAYEHCRLVSYAVNRGKGYALRRGFAEARGRLVAFIDADGEISPAALSSLLGYQQATGASVVVGKRVIVGARPAYRRLMTQTVRYIGTTLFELPVSDSQAGVKLFVGDDVRDLVDKCREVGYLFDMELLALAHYRGLPIHEIPVDVTILRTSRINVLTGLKHAGRMARLVLSRERLFRYASPHAAPQPASQPAPLSTSLLSLVLEEPLGK